GSAIAKIVGTNARNNSKFDSTDNMWVFEEMVNGRKLTDIINTDHENVKYLPGYKLLENVGVDEGPDRLKLISEVIHEKLGIKMSVWMGANIANEVW
ncbi:hypothetical protein cypCar_00041362, partial [Cyprinus carpio]